MDYEYKCVAAPEKAKRRRGAKTRTDRVAGAMEDILKAEGVGGWEYQRTDLIPVEEKSGMFSRATEVHRAVMVFRRPLASSVSQPAYAPVAAEPQMAPQPVAAPVAAPAVQVAPQAPAAAPMQVQEAPAPAASETDGDFRLAADRSAPAEPAAHPVEALRTPKGLG